MALEMELTFYEENKKEWMKHYENQFALIKERKLLGTFSTQQEAFVYGVQGLGNVPFLILKVSAVEETVQVPALAVSAISASPQSIH